MTLSIPSIYLERYLPQLCYVGVCYVNLCNPQDIDLAQIKDCEDAAIGSGIMSQNANMFTDKEQV